MKNIFLIIFIFFSVVCFADTLQNILQQKKIYIGTTGDYKPLTWYDAKTNRYQGSDIDLAKKLTKNMGVKPIFVKTSWPTLSTDLVAKKFDMAIGGISITPKREQDFIFSQPLQHDKKVALLRCEDIKKYKTIDDMNQPNVHIIENKGGANEQFAKQNLNKAQLILIANNQEVFHEIIKKKADVMITDGIEARFQKKQYPQLCMVELNKDIAPIIPKAIMLRKEDKALQQKINRWLEQKA